MENIYFNIDLYNYINNKTIHYNRKLMNCITLLKLIEENHDKISCKTKILKYINKLFQNNYKISVTDSIKINYNRKEIYYYKNNKSCNEFHNNIKINIEECIKTIDKYKLNLKTKNKKFGKLKRNKTRKIKKIYINYIKYIKEDKNFIRYIENINKLKEDLKTNINGKKFYCYINNKIIEDKISDSDIDFEINIKKD